ncbi:lactate utilization protein C [Microaerobacter geothermalis]|uniref:LutC/YkgG family protein n=1 Tax=Microaerobacter geothermalis TaxID=674972 RepID=UPI001F183684|nr:lactate utilization protein C [Microaerobacter geothermalis]MCF6092878.1 lactate utilization protein C [Microaerobacter geothermalis]
MASKEAFLKNIASHLGRERRSGVKPPTYISQPWDHFYKDMNRDELIEMFIANATKIGAKVIDAENEKDLNIILGPWISENDQVIIWNDERFEELKVYQALNQLKANWKKWQDGQENHLIFTEKSKVGIVFADFGVAETGSLALFHGKGKGRSVSLLPLISIGFVKKDTIVPRITQVLKAIHQQVPSGDLTSCFNFITGPSRSADIEMDLSIGVHGPGELVVLLI